jgi:hypothetical protein
MFDLEFENEKAGKGYMKPIAITNIQRHAFVAHYTGLRLCAKYKPRAEARGNLRHALSRVEPIIRANL